MNENQYCIRITGGRSNTPGCNPTWESSSITLNRNGVKVGTVPKGFTKTDFCLTSQDQVDSKNDVFEMSVDGSDGVRNY